MRFLLILLLAGCVTETDLARNAGTWAPDYPRVYVYTHDVAAACTAMGARYSSTDIVHGCSDAWGKVNYKRCTIVVPPNPPQWLVTHEDLHCKYGNFHR